MMRTMTSLKRRSCKHYDSWDGFDSYFRCDKFDEEECKPDCINYEFHKGRVRYDL